MFRLVCEVTTETNKTYRNLAARLPCYGSYGIIGKIDCVDQKHPHYGLWLDILPRLTSRAGAVANP
jgi:hypothetical protein